MMLKKLTRRRWLQSTLLPTSTALAGLGLVHSGEQALAQTTLKPSSLAITNVETFPLRHRMAR